MEPLKGKESGRRVMNKGAQVKKEEEKKKRRRGGSRVEIGLDYIMKPYISHIFSLLRAGLSNAYH